MKKITIFTLITIIAFFVISCGNSSKLNNKSESQAISMKPETTKIVGEPGICFDLVEKAYELTLNDDGSGVLTVEVVRNGTGIMFNPNIAKGAGYPSEYDYIAVYLELNIKDENGEFLNIEGKESGYSWQAHYEDINNLLLLNEGQSGKLRYDFEKEDIEKMNSKCTFYITSHNVDPTYEDVYSEESTYDPSEDLNYEGILEMFDNLSTVKLTEEDVEGLSWDILRFLRNSIFARHGYIFQSEDLKEIFSQFSWYRPRSNDVTKELNQIELYNINFIKSQEPTLQPR